MFFWWILCVVIAHPIHDPAPSIRDLTWGDINFLHTTDTHGWYSGHLNQKTYNGNWGDFISFSHHMRNKAESQGQDLLVIDSGDRHDGNGLSDVTSPNGLYSTPIFIKQHFDLLTIGNHELYLWENLLMEYDEIVNAFPQQYISSNVEILINQTLVPFGNKFKYFLTPKTNTKILAFGFLFDFNRSNKGTKVTPINEVIEQEWFIQTLEDHLHKTDLILIVTHVPISHYWPELYEFHLFIRKYYPSTTIQYFGGHSHIRDFVVFDKNATGLQSGRFCETVGWTSIKKNETGLNKFSRNYIDFNLQSFIHHSNIKDFDTEQGLAVSALINETRSFLDLDSVIGTVNTNYYVDYVPLDNSKNIFHLLTHRVLPTLEYLGFSKDERIVIINTGLVRYDLYKGPYTLDSQYIVLPFENNWSKIELPKLVAKNVARILNKHSYIQLASIDNRKLLPPQHYYVDNRNENGKRQKVFDLTNDFSNDFVHYGGRKLSKGYVTFDDFGHDGDDTAHKPVIQFPLTNVVESRQLLNHDETLVDLVFYDFIKPNILWALGELKYTGEISPEFYSSQYLGLLLNEFVRDNEI